LVAAALAAAAATAAALAEDKKNRKGTVWAVPFFRSLWLLFPRCLSTQKWGRGQLGHIENAVLAGDEIDMLPNFPEYAIILWL
jgi:hypothetical protein